MKINWFTVIAQIINFFILVGLLKRFLYKPILNAVEEREKKISDQLAVAAAKKAEANNEQEIFKQKNETFDAQRHEMLNTAIGEIQEQRKQMLEEARKEVMTNRSRAEKGLDEMQQSMNHAISQKIKEEVFANTRKSLAELASIGLEVQVINAFIQRLKEISDEEKRQFIAAFRSDSTTMLIKTAFELSLQQQAAIQNIIDSILETKATYQYKIAPELIAGIELICDGYKFAWNLSAYLSAQEKNGGK